MIDKIEKYFPGSLNPHIRGDKSMVIEIDGALHRVSIEEVKKKKEYKTPPRWTKEEDKILINACSLNNSIPLRVSNLLSRTTLSNRTTNAISTRHLNLKKQ